MDSFLSMASWASFESKPSAGRPSGRAFGHFRSLSSAPTTQPYPKSPRIPAKSPSTSELPILPSEKFSPSTFPHSTLESRRPEEPELSTIPDPRSRAMSPLDSSNSAGPPGAPNLADEVTTLSTKLIQAINHQTNLDNTAASLRHELNQAQARVQQLETQNASQQEMLKGDVWVRRSTVELEKREILGRLSKEKKARLDVEQEKRKIELELENLTTALFEEANKMVVSAKREGDERVAAAKEEAQVAFDSLQKRNEQLKAQVADAESLLRSHQEQLAELKHVMEQHMTSEHDDNHTNVTAPSSPGLSRFDPGDREDDIDTANNESLASPLTEIVSPAYPTSFSHLIQPVLRADIASYEDFRAFAKLSRTRPHSRVPSLSMSGGANSSNTQTMVNPVIALTTASVLASPNGSPQTPKTPASMTSQGAPSATSPAPALKESRFFKRVMVEDVEPTLRLDIAPGLSWLARRSVIASIADGSLIVEPVPVTSGSTSTSNPQLLSCTLCGESRREECHLRTHRFRTSEAESAQRYPLCGYCLGRLRATCDFLGFLRILRDGYWRVEDSGDEKAAWEESVRLREQMFWARIGGGVVPTGLTHAAAASAPPSVVSAPTNISEVLENSSDPFGPHTSTEPATADGVAEVDASLLKVDAGLKDTDPLTSHASTPQQSQEGISHTTAVEADNPKRLSLTIPTSGA